MVFSSHDRKVKSAVVALLALASISPVLAVPSGPLDPYLPKDGVIKGHVVTLRVAPEDQAISKQFQLAVQNNMDWFKHYVTANQAGVPLPYNPKMGVTEAQYQRLMHLKAEIQKQAPIDIIVRRGADGSLAFTSTDSAAASLQGTTFPPDEKIAETPYGKLTIFTPIHQKDANAPFGIWNGAEWTRVAEGGSEQPSVKIAFGKMEPSGEGLFYYQVAATMDKPEQSLIVVYPLD